MMQIGILGAGVVGSSLGKALLKAGHMVMFSSREPQSETMRSLLTECGPHASAGTAAETVAFGEVIVTAIGWQNGLAGVLKQVSDWSNKVIVDTTNRFGPPPAGSTGSAGEDIARITGAPVMKAFNTIGAEHLLDPVFGGKPVSLFICGDEAAKAKAASLVSDIGFEMIDAGGLDQCRVLEAAAELWVGLAYHRGYGRDIALTLARKG